MPGQMRWMDPSGGDGEKVLHLRQAETDPWLPYTAAQFSRLREGRNDIAFQGVKPSKGFRLSQYLLSCGWEYVSSPTPTVPVLDVIWHAQEFGLVQGGGE